MRSSIGLLMIVGVLLLTACAPTPELRSEEFLQDSSLVSGEPCLAPCWNTMIPGETVWDDAVTLLSENSDFTNLDRDRNRETGEELYNFTYQDGLQCCRIYTRDGELLSSILLLLTPDLAFSEIVELYNEPAFLNGVDATESQAFISTVFLEPPMVVYAFAEGLATGELTGSNEVIGVLYMAPSELELLLATEELYQWQGYGALSTIMSGEALIQRPN